MCRTHVGDMKPSPINFLTSKTPIQSQRTWKLNKKHKIYAVKTVYRFLPPIPKKPWSGVKDARKVPNSCVQIKGTLFGNFSGEQVWFLIQTQLNPTLVRLNHAKLSCSLLWVYYKVSNCFASWQYKRWV